jgi:hypothetical protein
MDERKERGEGFEGSVGGTSFNGHGRPSRTFPRGRICAEDGCETLLSIYNEGRFCFHHEPQTTPRMRGRKIA